MAIFSGMQRSVTKAEIVKCWFKEDKALFLAVQKAYDIVWQVGSWLKLWDMGVKGRIWPVINV